MAFFQDTAFGHLLRLISGGKLLAWPETENEDLRLKYIFGGSKRPSDASSSDLEKNPDHKLIEFLENDAQVCDIAPENQYFEKTLLTDSRTL